jgi:uncharacterized protein
MKTFVIMYHKFCQDGFCSAAIAHLYLTQLKPSKVVYFPVIAGHVDEAVDLLVDTYPETENIRVLSFDLSFTYTAAVKLFKNFTDAQVVDHHKTTVEECFTRPENVSEEEYGKQFDIFTKQLYFNNDHSGAVLAFKFFFEDADVPLLIKYVEDRDLWTWTMPDSKVVSAGLYRHLSMPYVSPDEFAEKSPLSTGEIEFSALDNERIPVFDQWIKWMFTEEWFDEVKRDGSIVIDIQKKNITRICKSGKCYEIDGQKVFVTNANSFISELGNAISEWTDEGKPAYNYALIWRYDSQHEICFVSMRSLQGTDNDVEAVAKKNGGGGHKHAAGFEIKLDVLFRVLKVGSWEL